MTAFSLTLRDKVSSRLMKYIVNLATGTKRLVTMESKSLVHCTNSVGSNPVDGETNMSAIDLNLTLFG